MKTHLQPDKLAVLDVLAALPNHHCIGFKPIMNRTELDRATVRRACRYLARKGLAEYVRGLWSEDGEMLGAGYGATKAGRELVEKIEPEYVLQFTEI